MNKLSAIQKVASLLDVATPLSEGENTTFLEAVDFSHQVLLATPGGNWFFATEISTPAKLAITEAETIIHGYTYKYIFPAGVSSVIRIEPNVAAYTVVGNNLFTNVDGVSVLYVKYVEFDVTSPYALYQDAVIYAAAVRSGKKLLSNSNSLAIQIQSFERQAMTARRAAISWSRNFTPQDGQQEFSVIAVR